MQNVVVGHDTEVRWLVVSILLGDDHDVPSYVRASPWLEEGPSTAMQNDTDGQETMETWLLPSMLSGADQPIGVANVRGAVAAAAIEVVPAAGAETAVPAIITTAAAKPIADRRDRKSCLVDVITPSSLCAPLTAIPIVTSLRVTCLNAPAKRAPRQNAL